MITDITIVEKDKTILVFKPLDSTDTIEINIVNKEGDLSNISFPLEAATDLCTAIAMIRNALKSLAPVPAPVPVSTQNPTLKK